MSTDDAETPAPVADLTYEQARDELVRLVARIESGQVPLEEAMVLWERGEELAAHCQTKLDAAQDTLDRATGEGTPVSGAHDRPSAEDRKSGMPSATDDQAADEDVVATEDQDADENDAEDHGDDHAGADDEAVGPGTRQGTDGDEAGSAAG